MVEQQRQDASPRGAPAQNIDIIATDLDPDYGHLVAHLVDDEAPGSIINYWTRVLSCDDLGNLAPAIHKLGDDLQYDKAVRDSLADLEAEGGEVLFSPFIFKREDLASDLDDCKLAHRELMGLGQVATTVK